MSDSSFHICKNCKVTNEAHFQYCSNCGQKNSDGKISFSELWSEFKDAVFNIESRTWLTFKKLFNPGRLTTEYFAGKHRSYVHPLRLLIVTSVICILAMGFQDLKSKTNHSYDINERIVRNYERQRISKILKNITDDSHNAFPEKQTTEFAETILTTFSDSMENLLFETDNEFAKRYGDRYRDSINLNQYVSFGSVNKEMVSKKDYVSMDENQLAEKYKSKSSKLERLKFTQKIKIIKDESKLFSTIIGKTTWAILLMMPCLALVLYLLYFRNNYLFIEHLIFTFHFQSFLFLVLTILIAGMNIFPIWLHFVFLIIIWIYLYISMLKVYKQSKVKTLFKFLILNASYFGLFILLLIGTIYVSFLIL